MRVSECVGLVPAVATEVAGDSEEGNGVADSGRGGVRQFVRHFGAEMAAKLWRSPEEFRAGEAISSSTGRRRCAKRLGGSSCAPASCSAA